MADDVPLYLVLALFIFVGAWMFIRPALYLVWLKSARPSLGIKEDNPQALLTTKFIGGCLAGGSVLILLALTLNRK